MARGFIPDKMRSAPFPHKNRTGLLRSPSGINPLTTLPSLTYSLCSADRAINPFAQICRVRNPTIARQSGSAG